VLLTCQADGSVKHWHVTSAKCLHYRCDDPENHLYSVDYTPTGSLFATAGRDMHIRIYDEQTKSLSMDISSSIDIVGHSNRIFCVKFMPSDPNILVSGGWDNTLRINDLRVKAPVGAIVGPHITGDSIDFRTDGVMLTGSYRADDCL